MAQKYIAKTLSMFPEDLARLADVSKRLSMSDSAVVRLALHIVQGHVRAVQNEVAKNLKPGDDVQHAFERQILNDFDFLMSGRVKLKKPKKTLEELKKTQIDLFS